MTRDGGVHGELCVSSTTYTLVELTRVIFEIKTSDQSMHHDIQCFARLEQVCPETLESQCSVGAEHAGFTLLRSIMRQSNISVCQLATPECT